MGDEDDTPSETEILAALFPDAPRIITDDETLFCIPADEWIAAMKRNKGVAD